MRTKGHLIVFMAITILWGDSIYASTGNITALVGFQMSDWSSDGQTLFVGKDYKIYRSTNGGASFSEWYTIPSRTPTSELFPEGRVNQVFIPQRISGENGDRMLVLATDTDKLYMCTDITQETPTFTEVLDYGIPRMTSGGSLPDGLTEDEDGNLYFGVYGLSWYVDCACIYKSTNRGVSWTLIKTFDAGHIHALQVNPYNGYLYAFTGEAWGYQTEFCGIYRSKDGGATWTRIFDGRTYYSSDPKGGVDFLRLTSMQFINNTVYCGEDTPQTYSSIFSFVDDGGDGPFTLTTRYTSDTIGDIWWTATKIANKLVFVGTLDLDGDPKCISSTDGTNWTLEDTATDGTVYSTGVTRHPDRAGRVIYSLSSSTGYYLDYAIPRTIGPGYSGTASWQ